MKDSDFFFCFGSMVSEVVLNLLSHGTEAHENGLIDRTRNEGGGAMGRRVLLPLQKVVNCFEGQRYRTAAHCPITQRNCARHPRPVT